MESSITTTDIPVTELVADPFNPRKAHDAETVKALADNIRAQGILSPLIVRPNAPTDAEGGVRFKYSVLCGSRRIAAARLLELPSVPCTVRQLSDTEAAEVALTEQSSHETLSVLEVAEHIAKWMDAGGTPKDIGVKLNRKQAWVYSTRQMTYLTPEGKRAVGDNRIEESTARKLATLPASAQGTALKRCLEPGLSGPKTVRECSEIIDSYRRDLSKAPFDATDTTLDCKEHVGGCETCPLRSGARPELFEDARPNLCTSPVGWDSKADISWKRQVEDGEHNRGPHCLSDKQSVKYFDVAGNLRDDAPYVAKDAICYGDTAQRPYGSLVSKAAPSYLARSPKGVIVELLGKEGLDKLLEESAKIRRPPSAVPKAPVEDAPKLSTEERKKHEAKVRRRTEAKTRAIGAMVEKVKKRGLDKKLMRFMADSLFHQAAVPEEVQARRDIKEKPSVYLDRFAEGDLAAFLFEAGCAFDLYGQPGSDKYPEGFKKACELLDVDVKEFENEVVAAERAQPKPIKKAVKS